MDIGELHGPETDAAAIPPPRVHNKGKTRAVFELGKTFYHIFLRRISGPVKTTDTVVQSIIGRMIAAAPRNIAPFRRTVKIGSSCPIIRVQRPIKAQLLRPEILCILRTVRMDPVRIVGRITCCCKGDCLQIALAKNLLRFSPGRIQYRQKNRTKNCKNRNHNKKFYYRKFLIRKNCLFSFHVLSSFSASPIHYRSKPFFYKRGKPYSYTLFSDIYILFSFPESP